MTPSGLIIVDKPGGWTSHDVVARIRRLAGTRRVGHAGTLDPMATGVLVVGLEKATRLLGYLSLTDKEYEATIRLGQATDSGDADGTPTGGAPAGALTPAAVTAAAATLTGDIQQVPPAISALKVGGRRAYQLARAGAPPELAPRPVTVSAFVVGAVRAEGDLLDVEVSVTCSTGTYVRALARDLGEALGVGGHLTRLRRTRVGPYPISQARELAALGEALPLVPLPVVPLAEVARAAFPGWRLSSEGARALAHGATVPAEGVAAPEENADGWLEKAAGPVAAFGPDGELVALVTVAGGRARPVAVFADQGAP